MGADVLLRDEDEQYTLELLNLVPDLEDAVLEYNLNPDDNFAKRQVENGLKMAGNVALATIDELKKQLELNPDDSAIQNRLKQTIDSALGLGIITGSLTGGFKATGLVLRGGEALTVGGAKIANKAYALSKQNILEPIAKTDTATAIKANVIESIPGTFRQGGLAYELVSEPIRGIAKKIPAINTALAKGLTSQAGMPIQLFRDYLSYIGRVRGVELNIDSQLIKLNKLMKDSDVDPEDITRH